jgi:hypothetical protein
MKLRKIIAGIVLTSMMLSTSSSAQAQRRTSRSSSLAQMSCQGINQFDRYSAKNQDIPIGFEMFRAVASLSSGFGNLIYKETPVTVVCRLAAAGQSPKYRTLTLAFGLSDKSYYSSGSTVRLAIYKDGNLFEYKDITAGEKLLWNIDVSGTRSLAMKAGCLRSPHNNCPEIYFFEDILE